MTMEEIIERFAIRCAQGNNGGEWALHYTDEQREHWRQFVRDLIVELEDEINGCDFRGISCSESVLEAER
jgi:hypothetical protein